MSNVMQCRLSDSHLSVNFDWEVFLKNVSDFQTVYFSIEVKNTSDVGFVVQTDNIFEKSQTLLK